MNALKQFVVDEFYFSIPMILMSLIAVTLVIWRLLLNSRSKTRMEEFLPEFQDRLTYDGVQTALEYCKVQDSMIPKKLYVGGLEASPQGTAAMKRSMASVLELEILPSYNFLLPLILAIAKIATMVGLLGTVISMISTFTAISAAKDNPSSVTNQAGSIGLALFATAFGLMTAIPLVFMHVLFKDFNSRQEVQMKAAAQRLIILFQNVKPKWDEGVRDREADEEERRLKEQEALDRLEEEEARKNKRQPVRDDEDLDDDGERDRKRDPGKGKRSSDSGRR